MKCPHCQQELELVAKQAKPAAAPRLKLETKPTPGDLGEMLSSIDIGSLNPWETEFVEGIKERYAEYGDRTKLSDKQKTILHKIVYGDSF